MRTHILLLALHLAGPFGPRPQILLRAPSIAEPGCRILLPPGSKAFLVLLFFVPDDAKGGGGVAVGGSEEIEGGGEDFF